jgi:hypothetical protein
MQRGVRPAVVISLAAMCSLIAGCGSGRSAASAPTPTIGPTPSPTSTAAIAAKSYSDAFDGLREADAQAPGMAALLASGLTKAAGTSGDPRSAAADLRATLTNLFTEHVALFGLVAEAVDRKGPEGDQTKAALKALRANSAALTMKINSLGQAARPSATPSPSPTGAGDDLTSWDFQTAWTAHNDELFDYAVAAKDKVGYDEDTARRDLGAWRLNAGTFFKDATNGKLRSTPVREALDRYLSGMLDGADSLARQDGKGYDDLRVAAAALADTAALLAEGFGRSMHLAGDSRDDASTVRARQTYLLTEHVDLTAAAVYAAYSNLPDGGVQSPEANAAKAALDANAKDLATSFGKVVRPLDQAQFLEEWRRHIIYLLNYAEAVALGNTAGQDKAVTVLDAYRRAAGEFFARVSRRKLAATDVAAALAEQIGALTGEIRAFAALIPPPAG